MGKEYEIYKKIFDKYKGVLKTSDFKAEGYHHNILKELIDKSVIAKIKRGYYEWQEKNIENLMIYAKKLRTESKIKTIIGVWL
ncbi:MAG: hypothetical protein MJB12_19590 [Firmicutes bacterium]|nr:hypothetical protein [Bacillota bacterium]